MKKNKLQTSSIQYEVFSLVNIVFLSFVALLCIAPMVNLLAVSFSRSEFASAGLVKFWPLGFTTASYKVVFSNKIFWNALYVSLERVILGTSITILLNVLTSYPLSKSVEYFPARRYYIWFFFFPTLFGGGLIPTFLIVKYTGLYNTIWALVLPGAAGIWNCILMLNFFRQLPKELEEAAIVDGAGHITILFKIFVPISKPVIATVTLFTMVGHWNDWFSGMIYMSGVSKYPLQTYLQSIINIDLSRITDFKVKDLATLASPKTLRAAMVFVTALPILMVYPFLQKYFAKGILLGSVKG